MVSKARLHESDLICGGRRPPVGKNRGNLYLQLSVTTDQRTKPTGS